MKMQENTQHRAERNRNCKKQREPQGKPQHMNAEYTLMSNINMHQNVQTFKEN